MFRYGGASSDMMQARVREIERIIPNLINELSNLKNKLKNLVSFDIEFAELQKEIIKSQSSSSSIKIWDVIWTAGTGSIDLMMGFLSFIKID
jgi:hypothetical protein